MAKATITEHTTSLRSANGHLMQVPGDYGVDQADVDFSGGAAQSAAFNSTTLYIRVNVDTAARVAFGANPTALTSGNRRLAKDQTEYFPVNGGDKISLVISLT